MDEVNVLEQTKNGPKQQTPKFIKLKKKMLIMKDRNYWDKLVGASSLG